MNVRHGATFMATNSATRVTTERTDFDLGKEEMRHWANESGRSAKDKIASHDSRMPSSRHPTHAPYLTFNSNSLYTSG